MKRLLLLLVMVCGLFLVTEKQSSAMAGYCPDFCYTGWERIPYDDQGDLWCCDIEQICCYINNQAQ
jgi:hypothetical protein